MMLELRPYCALSASLRSRPATRVAPIGSSDAVWNFLPVVICFCVFASWTWFSRMASMLLRCMPAVEMRMAYLRTALISVSNISFGRRDDLRRGLVGLLVAQHVGGFLVEVDAGDGVARREVAFVDRCFRVAAHLRRARLQAEVAGEPLDGRGHRDRAAFDARRAFMASASAKALRLSPTAPALLRTVKVSPVAGAPLICTRQPLTSMLPPAV